MNDKHRFLKMSDGPERKGSPIKIIELDISQYTINGFVPLDKTVKYQSKRDDMIYELQQQIADVIIIQDNFDQIELELTIDDAELFDQINTVAYDPGADYLYDYDIEDIYTTDVYEFTEADYEVDSKYDISDIQDAKPVTQMKSDKYELNEAFDITDIQYAKPVTDMVLEQSSDFNILFSERYVEDETFDVDMLDNSVQAKVDRFIKANKIKHQDNDVDSDHQFGA